MHGKAELKQDLMIMHENSECNIQETGKKACVWGDLPQGPPWVQKQCHACDSREMQWKNETMLLQVNMHQNDSKRSLKPSRQHLHKVNTKCNRNAAKDMKRILTPKKLSRMCQRLLDVMWDVRAPRSMWEMSSASLNKWFLIRLRLWHACHKSRKQRAYNLQLVKMHP